MINIFFIFFGFYILTFFGYSFQLFLKDEIKSLQKRIVFSNELVLVIYYIFLIFLFQEIAFTSILLFIFLIHILSKRFKKRYLKIVHNIFIFNFGFFILFWLNKEFLIFQSILIFSFFLENSIKKIDIKKIIFEILSLSLLFACFLIL